MWNHELTILVARGQMQQVWNSVQVETCMRVQTDCFCAVALRPWVPLLWCDPPMVLVAKSAVEAPPIQYFWTGSVLCLPSDDLPLFLPTGSCRLCSCSHSHRHCCVASQGRKWEMLMVCGNSSGDSSFSLWSMQITALHPWLVDKDLRDAMQFLEEAREHVTKDGFKLAQLFSLFVQ